MKGRQHDEHDPEGQVTESPDLQQHIADLEGSLAEKTQEAAENFDRLQRAVADLENYRRRARQEADDRAAAAQEQVVFRLLPVIDNFQRAFASLPADLDPAWLEGARLVQRQLAESLGQLGLERIETVGQEFDPREHEAIGEEETGPEVADGAVATELQAGYRFGGRVIRPALVRVARQR